MIVIVMADKVATGSDGVIVQFYGRHGRHCRTVDFRYPHGVPEPLQRKCDDARALFLAQQARAV